MKLILTAAVENLGIAGDVVEVRDGYARNFLLPRHYAIAWTKGAEKQIEGIKRARDAREIRDQEHAAEIRDQLEKMSLTITVNASESGKLFGRVTAADVANAIKKAGGPSVDKRAVEFLWRSSRPESRPHLHLKRSIPMGVGRFWFWGAGAGAPPLRSAG